MRIDTFSYLTRQRGSTRYPKTLLKCKILLSIDHSPTGSTGSDFDSLAFFLLDPR